MTPQEQQMIDGLIDRIRNTQVTDRDPLAADHLQRGLGSNPNALYILAQTVLVQQQALLQAQQQLQTANSDLTQFRQQSGQPAQPQQQSWLDKFFGGSSSQPQQQPPPNYGGQPYGGQQGYPPAQPPQPYGTPVYGSAPQPPYPPQGYPQQPYPGGGNYPPGYGYGQPSGGGSFLRSAATTAAGVAAGALIFEGVESMFSGHHNGYGYSGGGHDGTVINNYYEDKPEHHSETSTSNNDGSLYNPSRDASSRDLNSEVNNATDSNQALSSDIEDRRDDSRNFADTNSGDDTSNGFFDDNTAYDDSGSNDDSGSTYDDGGSFDSGGSDDNS